MKLSRFIAVLLLAAFTTACGSMQALYSESTTLIGPLPVELNDDSQIQNRKVHVLGYVQVDLDGIDTTNKTLPSVRQMLLEKAREKFGDVDAVVSLAHYHESILSSTTSTEALTTWSSGSNVYVEAAAIKYVE